MVLLKNTACDQERQGPPQQPGPHSHPAAWLCH